MGTSRKKLYMILALTVALVTFGGIALSGGLARAEQQQKQETTEDAAGADETTQAGQAAADIDQGLNRLEGAATSILGAWVKTEALGRITWLRVLFCLIILLIVFVVNRAIRHLIEVKLDKLPDPAEGPSWIKITVRSLGPPLSLLIWVYGVYVALSPVLATLVTPGKPSWILTVADKAALVGGTLALVWGIFRLIGVVDLLVKRWTGATPSAIDDMLAHIVGKTVRVIVVIVGGLLLIQNLTGMEIGALLASLGIGGLAFALAAKDTISNFFGTVTILLDKPFTVGDRIVVDGQDGIVETVGFRTTRLRTLDGHLISVPNEKMTNSSLENIGARPFLKWYINLTLTYDTPPEKVERAVGILEDIVADHEGMNPDYPPRVYFNAFNDWSLNIMIMCWYFPADWWAYQAWVQQQCLQILRRFNDEGIEFAFPSNTTYLAYDEKRQVRFELLEAQTQQSGGDGT